MSRNTRSALGIQIDGSELRIAEMQRTGNAPMITAVSVQELPAGAVGAGVVLRPELLADAISKALEQMGASARSAVLGLPAAVVTTRVLDVPIVSSSELRSVVAGEVIHFEILREDGGVFDFWPLRSPAGDGETEPQVLLMAVEESVLSGYRDALGRAGVQIDAIEPLHMGMYRQAYPQITSQGTSTFVSIGSIRTEIGLINGGELALYRRIEIGATDLLPDPLATADGDGLRDASVSSLATELRRSLDYFHREFPDAPVVARVILAAQHPRLTELAETLSPLIKAEVEMAKPDITAASTSAVATQLETPHGVNYIGAIGLAMDGIGAGSPNVPTFDLASRNGRGHELRAARKSLMTSMVAALVVTAIGGMGAAFLGTRMSKVNAGLEKTKAEHAALQARYRPESDARLARVNQLRDLSNEGIPFQPLMDAVSAALDPQAGLTTIRFEQGGGIKISGEATSELALINTMERMRQFPHFTNTIVDSFDKGGPNAKELGLRFSISTRYAGTFGNVPAALKPPQTELRTP